MNRNLNHALLAAGLALGTQAAAQVVFYEHDNFGGRSITAQNDSSNFSSFGFNDRASSVVVLRDRWEVCEDARFSGRCVVLRPGRYPSLSALGLNDRISSARMVARNARIEDNRYGPTAPVAVYDNQRRNNERLYEANVTSSRAVMATPTQRCWVEQEQVSDGRGSANVPGAIIGAVLGGVLGHQVGSGRGNDIATVGGAVAGGAIGANVGRNGQQTRTQDVQRCTTEQSSAAPDHWDVTYEFRSRQHRIQTTTPPGRTVTVNAQGEPRA
jgi:uncharacterized protein YcfJ